MRKIIDTKEKIIYLVPHCGSSSYFFHKAKEIDHWIQFNKKDEEKNFFLNCDISDHTVIMIVRDPYARFISWFNRFSYPRWFRVSKNVHARFIIDNYLRIAPIDDHTMLQKILYNRACENYDLDRAKDHKFLNMQDLWIWFDEKPHSKPYIKYIDDNENHIHLDGYLELIKDYLEEDYKWLDDLNYIYNFTNTKIKRLKYYKYEHAHKIFHNQFITSFRLH